jgi:CO/xanthine dehydrogenase Mo-binding subunit
LVSAVGKDIRRIDGWEKVTGKTLYAGDLSFPRMAHAKAFFSQRPHARILSMDLDKAEQLEGVIHIFTARDIGGSNAFGATKPHQPVLVPIGGIARFLGDALALVVAEDERIAQGAAELIRVEYEDLLGVFSIDGALSPDAPLIHPDSPGNICAVQEMAMGEVDKGFSQSDVIVDEWVLTSRQEHAYLEPEAAVGTIDPSGQIVLYSCIQDPHYFAADIAQAVGIPMSCLRIVGTSMGGGFGGKNDITLQVFVALAVQRLRRPVKMVYSREESFIASVKRHPMKIRVRLGATQDGKIKAMAGEILADAGPYSGRSPVVITVATHSFSGPYAIPNLKIAAKAVYTNNPVGGACRGYGQPQSSFAREIVMDRLAKRLKMDPVELRRKNFLGKGDRVGTPLVNLDSPVSMPKVLDQVLEAAGPPQPSSRPDRIPGRGVACVMPLFDIAALPSLGLMGAGVAVQLMSDGTLKVYSTAVEMGQGITTVLVQIAAHEFGLTGEEISVTLGDTDLAQKSGPTTASRQTYVSGNALLMALGKLKERLAEKAAPLLDEAPEKILFQDGEVVSPERGKGISLRELAKRCYYEGVNLREESWFSPNHAMIGHTFMATVADVEIDPKTGQVSVKQLVNGHDTGRAIYTQGALGQLIGGSVMSLGWALNEDFVSEKGRPVTESFSEYLVPTAMDVLDVRGTILEDPYPTGPYGAKGVGEHATVSTTPAIINAINQATGCFFHDLPVTPEKIFWRLGKTKSKAGD